MLTGRLERTIRRFVPRPRLLLRKIYYFPLDTLDSVLGRREELIPPRSLVFIGGDPSQEVFRQVGQRFFQFFVELCELQPSERVLDVGSGIGRMAVPLTRYLDRTGSYEGFDIIPDGIKWCKENISRRFPNFQFSWANVFNGMYNRLGKQKAREYRFPYEEEAVDFVILTSVFTHMLPDDMQNYLSETRRVLKRSGRCLITFFLLNSESLKLIQEGRSSLDFAIEFGPYRTISRKQPEAAIAYQESYVLRLLEGSGLRIRGPIHYGSWCGRAEFLDYQDIVIASRI